MVVIIIPLLVLLLWSISRYYAGARTELESVAEEPQPVTLGRALVPVFRLDLSARAALRYAMALSPEVVVVVVHLARNEAEASRFNGAWGDCHWPAGQRAPRLYTRVCRRRGRMSAFLAVLDTLQRQRPVGSKKPELGHDQTGASAAGAVGERGPLAPDEIAMPAQQGLGADEEAEPVGARQAQAETGEQEAISRPPARPLALALDNAQLVTEDEELRSASGWCRSTRASRSRRETE